MSTRILLNPRDVALFLIAQKEITDIGNHGHFPKFLPQAGSLSLPSTVRGLCLSNFMEKQSLEIPFKPGLAFLIPESLNKLFPTLGIFTTVKSGS